MNTEHSLLKIVNKSLNRRVLLPHDLFDTLVSAASLHTQAALMKCDRQDLENTLVAVTLLQDRQHRLSTVRGSFRASPHDQSKDDYRKGQIDLLISMINNALGRP